ncbi:M23 family metallopeptidase [Notoacmeibacter sp. MSK16QG-6]|uniref:M23 family metallopeptidase n=1 Tax=Notoacmeibacter sp. MSK16QG-6 TaxID=2957982 RepID=UPI00209D815E|nr:M23 family metallopeptidase [Notoacmeibacter sp. MSK16QG-6]MCP1197841.1 M23 family metallopeptidase [Notoacmeibacter sp. MSK16QG-6]
MLPADSSQAAISKKRKTSAVIISHDGTIRQFQLTLRGRFGVIFLGSALAIGYLASTAYLVVRDDLIAGKAGRQAHLEYAYEDRISALRRQVDRITSRQMLDQNLVEMRMTQLMERQDILASRSAKIAPLLREFGVTTGSVPLPQARPDRQAMAPSPTQPLIAATELKAPLSLADRADIAFVALQHSLTDMENQQIREIGVVGDKAEAATTLLNAALDEVGVTTDAEPSYAGMGGPFEPVLDDQRDDTFGTMVERLDIALNRYVDVKKTAVSIPLANPLPDQPISSRFGVRKDPILGRRAMHSGLDFSAPRGLPILATADGVVVKAGRNGGYGRMVEIRHADGLSTRYAHMSRVTVKVGQAVQRGMTVGKVGSTGRSTGPHLHYEVRRHGDAINPLRFLKAGETVAELL